MEKSLHSAGQLAVVSIIRQKREAAGLTQAEVAKAFGRRQDWMAHLESGQRRVDVVEFIRLSGVIGFDAVEEFSRLLPIVMRA